MLRQLRGFPFAGYRRAVHLSATIESSNNASAPHGRVLGMHEPAILLIGPYDPHCGEYTFLAPPLGVWRLAGVLEAAGARRKVFDPNCCAASAPQRALERELLRGTWDVVGVSTTGMTLRFDLELAHLARRIAPRRAPRRRRHGGDVPARAHVRVGSVRSRGAGRGRASVAGDADALARGAAARRDRRNGRARPRTADLRDAAARAGPRRSCATRSSIRPYEKMPYDGLLGAARERPTASARCRARRRARRTWPRSARCA